MFQGTAVSSSPFLCLPAGLLSILVTELFLNGLLMEVGGWGPWISHRVERKCHSDFREDSGYCPLPWSHTFESMQDYFPDLGWAVPLGDKQVGCLETAAGDFQKPGVCFIWLSHEGVAPVWFLGKCKKWQHPKPVSDTP